MLLSVIIVHYRVPNFLEQCICSLETALNGLEAEIVVVDNDDSKSKTPEIKTALPVKRINTNKNMGFAAACNMGWRVAAGKWVLLLNPDTLVTAAAIRGCLTQIINDDSIGAIGCRLINGNGRFLPESKRSFPSPLNAAAKMLGLAHLFPTSGLFNQYALGNIAVSDSCSVEVLTGAFLLTSRSVLENTNGLDESFFLYGEDIDFCKKIAFAGKQCWYRGTDSIIHFKGASSPSKGKRYFYHFYRAMIVYCNKHYSTPIKQLLQVFVYVQWALHRVVWSVSQIVKTHSTYCDFPKDLICVGSEKDTSEILANIGKRQLNGSDIRAYNWDEWTSKAGSLLSSKERFGVLFCIGTLHLQTVIQWLESNPIKNPVFFRYTNSQSIVGSEGSWLLAKKGM